MKRYEILVTCNGSHLFATHERSIASRSEAVTLFKLLRHVLAHGNLPSGSPRYIVTLTEISVETGRDITSEVL